MSMKGTDQRSNLSFSLGSSKGARPYCSACSVKENFLQSHSPHLSQDSKVCVCVCACVLSAAKTPALALTHRSRLKSVCEP
jgi:hypothetical protein